MINASIMVFFKEKPYFFIFRLIYCYTVALDLIEPKIS